ncbi:MAG: hypothetical protein SRB2_02843 [Desulfobacteraceae bacterium Eth-SRB2]|nr:MAG: hypothetical protein SRB2_02843 [Desulfobacteraceae bacterium Eth-SRB2]
MAAKPTSLSGYRNFRNAFDENPIHSKKICHEGLRIGNLALRCFELDDSDYYAIPPLRQYPKRKGGKMSSPALKQ